MVKRFTRAQALDFVHALPEDLADLEARGLLVPNRPRRFLGVLGGREEYYTESQVDVLRWLIKTRRAVEASRR